jgi:hypothetical protein
MVLIHRLISTWFHKTHAHSGGRGADRPGASRYPLQVDLSAAL